MDTFPLQRMTFNGKEMVIDPPFTEPTGYTTSDPKDPEYVEPERILIDLNSENALPWE